LDVAVWNTATWQTVTNLRIGTSARAFFTPDGRWLVGGSHGQFVQWETGSWRVRRQFSGQPDLGSVYMAFSPDSQLLAIRKSGTEVQIVSLEDGHEIITLPGKSPFPLCFSPDGVLLAVAEEQTRVRLWDLRAVREELAKMNLDWDLPPYAPAPKTNSPAVRIKVITN
jgi:WD40 repeat protein